MMFHNKLPVSTLYQQWVDEEMPPDEWYLHLPSERRQYVMPEDLECRFRMLVVWVIYNSYWDQCVRLPKVSSQEFQFIVDYATELGRECNLLVPVALTDPLGWELPLSECVFDHCWSHYPRFVIDSFAEAGIELNPTSPIDDERHPCYNEWESYRQHVKAVEAASKPKAKIERATGSESLTSIIWED